MGLGYFAPDISPTSGHFPQGNYPWTFSPGHFPLRTPPPPPEHFSVYRKVGPPEIRP